MREMLILEQLSAATVLRTSTKSYHNRVDDAFSQFDLTKSDHYCRFLCAHATAAATIEDILAKLPSSLGWHSKLLLLTQDLAQLHCCLPSKPPVELAVSDAQRWGYFYVVEGSRLGSVVLERRLPTHLPRRFLSDRHKGSEWRDIVSAINHHYGQYGDPWLQDVIIGAIACFNIYCKAAYSFNSENDILSERPPQ
jgi:heme oxygenase (biliverdin-IX-beta and delta-forming)